MSMDLRESIFDYALEKYGVEPDRPFLAFPDIPVLRHTDSRKWFAIIMRVRREKLGLTGKGRVDVINVKLGDPWRVEEQVRQPGYFYGYHIRGGGWMSILLDGTVPEKEIFRWIDESYMATAPARERRKLRPPKEWLVPANPAYYDIAHAFDGAGEISWKQGSGIIAGDTVFVYAGAPVSAILYGCTVTETGIPFYYNDGRVAMTALMKLRLQKRFDPLKFPFATLKAEYGVRAIRGPRGVPPKLSEELKK